jgi:large subunit ribosomal protein L6
VRRGYVKGLQLVGIGYKVEQKGPQTLELRVGKSHPVTVELPPEVRPIVAGTDKIYITGVNKELVGQAAASIRRVQKINAYTGKGIHEIGAKEFKKKEFRRAGK